MRNLSRLVLLILLITGCVLPQASTDLKKFAEDSVYDVWYGVYALDHKLGYYHMKAELSADGRHYVVSEEMIAVTTFAGERSEDSTELVIRYSLDDGKIVSSEGVEKGGGERLATKVSRVGEKMRVDTDTGTRKQTRSVPIPKSSLDEELRFVQWVHAAEPGDTFETVSLDWSDEDVETAQVFIFNSKKQESINGVITTVYNLTERSNDVEGEVLIDEKGLPIKQKVGGLIELRREPKESAIKLEAKPLEVLAQTTIRSDVALGEEPLTELTLAASGLGSYRFPEAAYQKTEYLPEGEARLTIKPRADKPLPAELSPEDRQKYLRATPQHQKDAPEIQQVVKRMKLDRLTDRQKVEKLNNWVYNYLTKVSNQNAGTSLSVLDNEAGDCTEHTLLLVTLLRSVGIPARELGGLAYTNDQLQVFGYHAWVEVYFDGGWMAIDPTFNQVPADAAHILQSRDDSQAELQVMGKLKLSVLHAASATGEYSKPAKGE